MSASLSGSAFWPSSCSRPWESGFGASVGSRSATEPGRNPGVDEDDEVKMLRRRERHRTSYSKQSRRVMIHAKDHCRRPGFNGWSHEGAWWDVGGTDQGLQVRRLGDALFRLGVRRHAALVLEG